MLDWYVPLSRWRWLVKILLTSWFLDIDARVRSDLETQKVAFEKEIEKIDQEGRKIAGDIRTLEEEAATLHKQRVREMLTVSVFRCIVEYKRIASSAKSI